MKRPNGYVKKGLPFAIKVQYMTIEEAEAILMSKLKEGEESVKKEGWMTVEESKSLLKLQDEVSKADNSVGA